METLRRHKFLDFPREQKPSTLSGVIEADETFFPVSCKGQKINIPRPSKKRLDKTKDGAGPEKTAVVVAVQRGTSVEFDKVRSGATSAAPLPLLGTEAILSTDGDAAYGSVAKDLGVESSSFVAAFHGKGGVGIWHVPSVNRYGFSLKT